MAETTPDARVALVTGANRGIGRAIAEGLAREGLTVLITARDGDAAERVAADVREDGRRALSLALDVTKQKSVDDAQGFVERGFGRLDVLVNNAGAYFDRGHSAVAADLDLVQKSLDVNLVGPWRMARAFVPIMQRHGYGRIVNLSSSAAAFSKTQRASTPAYSVAKAGLNMLTVKLAAELRGTGILVNAAAPGWVRTEMGGSDATLSPEEGAETPIWLAMLLDDGPTGGFFQDRSPIPW